MGKATRWLKGLFGTQSKENYEEMEYSVQPKDKIRWSSGPLEQNGSVLCRDPPTVSITPAEASWLRSFYNEPDNEQKQHARAVAAATAAAADAAIAAAQAAATMVRLTSHGRNAAAFRRAKLAAARIQTAFRGYLARKALRALKGLVKIQALVRGFLVRKQAAATLRRMQALVRAQESVRAQKARRPINPNENFRQARKSSAEDKKEHPSLSLGSKMISSSPTNYALEENARIVEIDTGCWPKSRPKRAVTWILDLGGDESSVKAVISSPGPGCGLITLASDDKSGVCADTYPILKAKQRSRSAPKQRPGPNRSHSLLESRNSLRMTTTTSSRAQEAINFKNAVIGKLGRSPNFVKIKNAES